MRLWHYSLIPLLPRQQLLGLHRKICALRGNGWDKKHATVDYVFTHSPYMLYWYHCKVMLEMFDRGYTVDTRWSDCKYRGKQCSPWDTMIYKCGNYPEHDDDYLRECIENLREKNVIL